MSYRSLMRVASSPQAILTPDLENRLKALIRRALLLSASGEYTPQEAMRILDQAWEAQRLLWKLRDHRPD